MFEIGLTNIDNVLTVAFAGEFEFSRIPDCAAILSKVKTIKAGTYIADLSKLTFIDSSGLGVLISLSNSAAGAGTRLRIKGAAGQVAEIMKVTKFGAIADIE
jgi:anti-anti-sigma factor